MSFVLCFYVFVTSLYVSFFLCPWSLGSNRDHLIKNCLITFLTQDKCEAYRTSFGIESLNLGWCASHRPSSLGRNTVNSREKRAISQYPSLSVFTIGTQFCLDIPRIFKPLGYKVIFLKLLDYYQIRRDYHHSIAWAARTRKTAKQTL